MERRQSLPSLMPRGKRTATVRSVVRRLAAYIIAIAIICWLARGLKGVDLMHALQRANLWIFIPACALSVVCWLIGETFLYAKLFSYFHGRTTFSEMLPVNAVQEFLQAVNTVAASSALVLFVHRRKGAPWLTAGCTLLFQAFIDLQVIAWVALAGALVVPAALFGMPWYYPALAVVTASLFAWFWKRGLPHAPALRWLYERPSMSAFRAADLTHYLRLMLIRLPIFLAQALVLYFELIAFGLHVPLVYLVAFVPALILLGTLPIAPAGLGPRQAIVVLGLSAFGSRVDLLALSLGHSIISLILRLPLGLFIGPFMRAISVPKDSAAIASA